MLLGDLELLILDESANGLDPEGVRWLRDFLRSLASEGRTVLISSHVLAEIAQTADRVLIISRGRLVLSSPLAELTARAGGAVRVRSGDPQRLTTALHIRALQVTTGTDHALLVQGASSERIGEIAFAAGAHTTSSSRTAGRPGAGQVRPAAPRSGPPEARAGTARAAGSARSGCPGPGTVPGRG